MIKKIRNSKKMSIAFVAMAASITGYFIARTNYIRYQKLEIAFLILAGISFIIFLLLLITSFKRL